jgi:hypothetical protein
MGDYWENFKTGLGVLPRQSCVGIGQKCLVNSSPKKMIKIETR